MKLRYKFFSMNKISMTEARECEKIADDYAVEFLSWCNRYKHYSDKTNTELLEIFKKEKALCED